MGTLAIIAVANTGGIYQNADRYWQGYRIYYARIGDIICLLTNGGDKKETQQQDISDAQVILKNLNN